MAYNPWLTSNDLLDTIKRKISFPTAQATFTDTDLLNFANEEMAISQVPSVMEYHEEYYVTVQRIPLVSGMTSYPVPERAIGMRLRGVFWEDNQGNLFEMTRVHSEDRAFFQSNIGANEAIHKFYLEGNSIILTPLLLSNPTGNLYLTYFIRPNQLVTNDKAGIIYSFQETITINNSTLTIGDQLTITFGNNVYYFQAVASGATSNQFNIGGTSLITAQNLSAAINNIVPSIGTATAVSRIGIALVNYVFTGTIPLFHVTTHNANGGIILPTILTLTFNSLPSPVIFNNATIIDFLQTKPGHKIKGLSVTVPTLDTVSIDSISIGNPTVVHTTTPHNFIAGQVVTISNTNSTPSLNGSYTIVTTSSQSLTINSLITVAGTTGTVSLANGLNQNSITFNSSDIPTDLVGGDYIALQYQAIIPYLPPDLHSALAERTCARILAALGDQAGVQISNAKIAEMNKSQGTLLDNRVDGNSLKVSNRKSLLRFSKMGYNRRV